MTQAQRSFNECDWDSYARCYDTLTQLRPYQELIESVVRHIPQSAKSILDAGCGTGTLLRNLATRRPEARLFGIDGSPQMLALARAKLADTTSTIKQSDLESSDTFVGTYDCIVSTNVLYTLRDPREFLERIRNSLATNGQLVIATPKANYDNGLILKSHCNDQREDSFWRDPHQSVERENMLITEAFGHSTLADDMRLIADYNRRIYRTQSFHFFEQSALLEMMVDVLLEPVLVTDAYAHQCLLIVAKRR